MITVVDSTLATPVLQNPLNRGADIVMHATTKYLGGHSDIQGGALIFRRKEALCESVKHVQHLLGAVAILRGPQTLIPSVLAYYRPTWSSTIVLSAASNLPQISFLWSVTKMRFLQRKLPTDLVERRLRQWDRPATRSLSSITWKKSRSMTNSGTDEVNVAWSADPGSPAQDTCGVRNPTISLSFHPAESAVRQSDSAGTAPLSEDSHKPRLHRRLSERRF